jgi:hypothetical protein
MSTSNKSTGTRRLFQLHYSLAELKGAIRKKVIRCAVSNETGGARSADLREYGICFILNMHVLQYGMRWDR